MLDLCLFLAIVDDENDQIIFRETCLKYKEDLFNIAMGITKNYYDAQDAISLSLHSIARNIKNIDYKNEERTKGYIFKIVKNASYDVLRKKNKTNKIYNLDDFENIVFTESLSDYVEGNEQYKSIVLLIQSMPELYRDILSLYYVHGLTVTKISKSLRKPLSTVRKQLKKGTELLKQILREANFYE